MKKYHNVLVAMLVLVLVCVFGVSTYFAVSHAGKSSAEGLAAYASETSPTVSRNASEDEDEKMPGYEEEFAERSLARQKAKRNRLARYENSKWLDGISHERLMELVDSGYFGNLSALKTTLHHRYDEVMDELRHRQLLLNAEEVQKTLDAKKEDGVNKAKEEAKRKEEEERRRKSAGTIWTPSIVEDNTSESSSPSYSGEVVHLHKLSLADYFTGSQINTYNSNTYAEFVEFLKKGEPKSAFWFANDDAAWACNDLFYDVTNVVLTLGCSYMYDDLSREELYEKIREKKDASYIYVCNDGGAMFFYVPTSESISAAKNRAFSAYDTSTLSGLYQTAYQWVVNAGVYDGMDKVSAYKRMESYICSHCYYDGTLSRKYWPSMLTDGCGVCNAYSELLLIMCRIAGIECYKQVGDYYGASHAWNRLVIDGRSYWTDVTFVDNNGSGWSLRTSPLSSHNLHYEVGISDLEPVQ